VNRLGCCVVDIRNRHTEGWYVVCEINGQFRYVSIEFGDFKFEKRFEADFGDGGVECEPLHAAQFGKRGCCQIPHVEQQVEVGPCDIESGEFGVVPGRAIDTDGCVDIDTPESHKVCGNNNAGVQGQADIHIPEFDPETAP
jgi:hypothetical protein